MSEHSTYIKHMLKRCVFASEQISFPNSTFVHCSNVAIYYIIDMAKGILISPGAYIPRQSSIEAFDDQPSNDIAGGEFPGAVNYSGIKDEDW